MNKKHEDPSVDKAPIKDLILKSSVRRALDLIGDRWTLLVILGAFYGSSRFDDWLQHYKMSSSVLSDRLKRLQKNGILVKERIENSRRYRYVLTEAGKELFPWALAVWHWENLRLYQDEGHPVSLVHTVCGKVFTPQYLCVSCKEPVKWADVIVREGPGIKGGKVTRGVSSRRSTVSTDSGAGGQNYGRIVDIFGDRWSYLIISAAFYHVRRFEDFQNELDIAPGILSDRLRRLVDHGLLARSRYREHPARWEYILTEKTLDFAMVPLMLGLWGDKWLRRPEGPATVRLHERCGQALDVRLTCSACQADLEPDAVRFQETATLPSAI
jgi:DNA-binding HxlR family transcriptional regulator